MNYRSWMGRSLLALCMAMTAAVTQAADYPKLKLKMGHFLAATFAQAEVDQWFADEVKRRSGGAIEIEIYWAGSMGNASELLGLVSAGAIELAAFPTAYYPTQFGLSGVGSMPRVFSDVEGARRMMLSVFDLPEVRAEHKKAKVNLLMSHFSNPYRLICNKPVERVASLRGYRARSTGEWFPSVFSAIGLVPVNTPANEVYESLDRGNLNCAMLSYDQMQASRIYEVAKYASDINMGALATWQIWMNDAAFQRQPAQVKELLIEVGRDAMNRDVTIAKEALGSSVRKLEEHGVTFQRLENPDELRGLIPTALDMWARKMGSAGHGAAVKSITGIVGKSATEFQ